MKHTRRLLLAPLLSFILLSQRASAQEETRFVDSGVTDAGSLREMIERYSADLKSMERRYSIDISPVRNDKLTRFYQVWLTAIEELAFDSLAHDEQIDYLLFRNHLVYALSDLEILRRRTEEVINLLPFAGGVIRFEEERQMMNNVDPQGSAALLDEMSKELRKVRESLESGLDGESDSGESLRTTPALAYRAAETTQNMRNHLSDWFRFYDHYDPLFSWWVEAPCKKFDKDLEGYAAFLREKVAGASDQDAIIGDPIGRNALLTALAAEMIPYSPEELIGIAEREYDWCETEMKRASAELGYGNNWRDALEHVKNLFVEPGSQPALIRDLAYEAVAFLEERNLVTIPALAKESWRMQMMSAERQKVSPFFTGGEVISVAFPVDTMQHEQKMMSMRGNNIHFSRATVHHELIPGHHLQQFMMSRYKQYRSIFWTPFWIEGWALYWEMILWDLDFARSPEDRVGMLFWRMHRCARIIFSFSFHLGKMTPQECIDLLVEKVGHERDNATAEVRRSFGGSYPPLYQAAYMIGALQFRALEREMTEKGELTPRQFRDAVLRENTMPIEMLRALLSGMNVTREYHPNWRFYGEPR